MEAFALSNSDIFSARDLEIWNREYKDIKNQKQLQSLLKSIGSKYELSKLEAYKGKNVIRIRVKRERIIEKFDIKMSISEFVPDLQSSLAYLILKVDSGNTDDLIRKKVKHFMIQKGFFNLLLKLPNLIKIITLR